MQTDSDYLFVYGTLTSRFNVPAARALRRSSQNYTPAQIPSARLHLIMDEHEYYPALVMSDQPTDIVQGELYTLLPDEKQRRQLLSKLDQYEFYFPYRPDASIYTRRLCEVRTKTQKKLLAWTYVFNLSVFNMPLIRNGDYVALAAQLNEEDEYA
jgi:gamma-glutamylcyclotransferase (GGCT)/AIG2-like uncharacterized protein YtfP